MNAKDAMIESVQRESPWFTLAKAIVRTNARQLAATTEEVSDESVHRVEISEASGS